MSIFVLPSLYVTYHENYGTSATIFIKNSVQEINKYINFIMNNIDLMESQYLNRIKMFADNFIYYFSIFMHNKINNAYDSNLVEKLIYFYSQKLNSDNVPFLFFQELKALSIISKEYSSYADKEFWCLAAMRILRYIDSGEFSKQIIDLIPKRIKDSKDAAKKIELNSSSNLFYSGLIFETFSYANYNEYEFWQQLFDKMNSIINIRENEPIILLHFTFLYCKKLVRDDNFFEVYKLYCRKLLNNDSHNIFINREIIDFALKVNFSNKEIEVSNIDFCLKKLFTNTNTIGNTNSSFENDVDTNKKNYLGQYMVLLNLLEYKLFSNQNVAKIMVNTLLDILKLSEERFSDKLVYLKQLRRVSSVKFETIINLIIERMIVLIKTSENPEDLLKNENILNTFIYSGIFGKLELVKIKFRLEKEEIEKNKLTGIENLIETFRL